MTVVTHAVPIAAQLAGAPQIELHLLPGRVRRHTHAAVGPETVQALDQIRADLAFIGTNGITLDHGLSTPDRTEAAVKRAIIERARLVVVLADASKIGVERTSSSPNSPPSTPSSPTRRSPPVTAGPSNEPASR